MTGALKPLPRWRRRRGNETADLPRGSSHQGQWIPIYSSHRRDWVERALAVYGRIVMWPVRFVDAPLAKEAGE